ncbi:MAG: bifunctional oligoribonuclease/PAP phosphatase NrnA [Syntrophales bacterium]|jgi:nanoRNase/pAp phosphatase (c-di-AMP/oligoRNAs hydrolase)|nr:bifunctional oligoribonuclease/PAP phosphatase NrnA [Syntrophales bacterium]MCK9528500.1 bifunctional oligoribonuclease/PAP phosphatase NrnA [Syntrophales bacterium]MDX9923037.1 bifunctional oligoribonuclease/PAP phosphatase NrnA [Syntrophales bacterium]
MAPDQGTVEGPAHNLLGMASGKRSILIVCHNNPDPDSMAAAQALKTIFLSQNHKRKVVIGYGGIVGRAENRQMIRRLKIEITPIRDIDFKKFSLVCLVDSQPRTGNNDIPRTVIPHVVIDHHPLRPATKKSPLYDVRPGYGSSSTILTEYLIELGLVPDRRLATALFYGLKTDTGGLSRSVTKPDLAALNYLLPLTSPRTLAAIETPPVPKGYYLKYVEAIENAVLYQDVIVTDLGRLNNPEIVAEMADFLLRMETIRWVLAFGEYRDELILSVRTSRKGWWAGKIALRLVRGIGSGGGHERAAGGTVLFGKMSREERNRITGRLVGRFLKAVVGSAGVPGKPLFAGRSQEGPPETNNSGRERK